MRTILDFLTTKRFRNIFTLICMLSLILKYYFGDQNSEVAQDYWSVVLVPLLIYWLLTPSFASGALGAYDTEATDIDMFLRLFSFATTLYLYVMLLFG